MGYSLESIQENVQNVRKVVSVVSAVLFFIGLLCVLAISTLITDPLHQMVRTTRRIADGDMDHRLSISSKDELGLLAVSFNKMIDSLEASYSKIVDTNEQLSVEISDREHAEKVQAVLLQISEATNRLDNLEEIFEISHQQLGRLIDTRNFYVALYHEDKDLYSFEYCVDEYDQLSGYEKLANSLTDYVRRTGQPLMVDEPTYRELERKQHVKVVGTPAAGVVGLPPDSERLDYRRGGGPELQRLLVIFKERSGYPALYLQPHRHGDRS